MVFLAHEAILVLMVAKEKKVFLFLFFEEINWIFYWSFFLQISGEAAAYPDNYLKGQKGEQGFDGAPGAHGPTGESGPRGPPGNDGPRGYTGLKGLTMEKLMHFCWY